MLVSALLFFASNSFCNLALKAVAWRLKLKETTNPNAPPEISKLCKKHPKQSQTKTKPPNAKTPKAPTPPPPTKKKKKHPNARGLSLPLSVGRLLLCSDGFLGGLARGGQLLRRNLARPQSTWRFGVKPCSYLLEDAWKHQFDKTTGCCI